MAYRIPSRHPSFQFEDPSFPSMLVPCSYPSLPTYSAYPSPSPDFQSSHSVYHSSPCIDRTFLPATPNKVIEFECVKDNEDNASFMGLVDIFDLKSFDNDAKKIDELFPECNDELFPEFKATSKGFEPLPSNGTSAEGATLAKGQEDNVSGVSVSSPELESAAALLDYSILSDSHYSIPDLVSPSTIQTVSAHRLQPVQSAATLHECSSALYSNAAFPLDSPVRSELTFCGSSTEPRLCELQICEVDSLSTEKKDTAYNKVDEPQETSPVVIQVETEDLNLNDGYVWRKYGEKTIKDRLFRRNYFKCAHNGCPIRKKTERVAAKLVWMTYTGRHNHPS